MMGKKRTEVFFALLLLLACQTAEPPGEDQPAASAATETTAPDAQPGPVIAPREWIPPAPTQTPPDPSDTLAWTEYYAARIGFPKTFFMESCGGEGMEPFEEKRLVYSDTAFDLRAIDERMEGELRFGWEPMDKNSQHKSDWNITGVQWLEVAPAASDTSNSVQRVNLKKLLHVEAWTFTDTGTIDAKEIGFTDINLDGYLDLKLLEGVGKSSWYVYLPWDSLEQQFVVDSSLLQVSDHLFYDCQKGLLHEYIGGTGSGTSWYSFEFDPTNHTFQPTLAYDAYLRKANNTKDLYMHTEYRKIIAKVSRPNQRPLIIASPDSTTILLRQDSVLVEM